VAEAADRSGSLNTATHAIGQNKDLMVAPGDINRESSRGCNKLLLQGAMPYTGPEDLLEALFPGGADKIGSLSSLGSSGDLGAGENESNIDKCLARLASKLETEVERKIVALILAGTQEGEQIMQRLAISVAEFNQIITVLEVKGVVKGVGMNKWMVRG